MRKKVIYVEMPKALAKVKSFTMKDGTRVINLNYNPVEV
jgi:hypothetical protein